MIVVLTSKVLFHDRPLRDKTERAAREVAFIPQVRGGRTVNATPILLEEDSLLSGVFRTDSTYSRCVF